MCHKHVGRLSCGPQTKQSIMKQDRSVAIELLVLFLCFLASTESSNVFAREQEPHQVISSGGGSSEANAFLLDHEGGPHAPFFADAPRNEPQPRTSKGDDDSSNSSAESDESSSSTSSSSSSSTEDSSDDDDSGDDDDDDDDSNR